MRPNEGFGPRVGAGIGAVRFYNSNRAQSTADSGSIGALYSDSRVGSALRQGAPPQRNAL
jgi:hypothetical protein